MKKFIYLLGSLKVVILLSFSVLSITNSCTKASDTPGPNEVFIQGMAFTPSTITVNAGTEIIWTNKGGVTHTVTRTSNPDPFDSGSISNNEIFRHTFSTAGTFSYKCTIHPSMTGSVIVN
jgi:plastocyanin